MAIEIGESFVGAYLRIVLKCPVIQYNAIDTVNLGKQGEVDVLGVDYQKKQRYDCEVITHLGGALYSQRADGTPGPSKSATASTRTAMARRMKA